MPNATIDKVQVEVEATAKGTSAVFTQLERQLNTLKQALGGIDITQLQNVAKASRNLSVDTSGMTKAEKQVSSSVNKIQQSLAGLKAYKEAALSGDSSSLTTFQRKVIHLQSDIDVLGKKLEQLGDNRTGLTVDTDPFQTYRDTLAEVQKLLNSTRSEVEQTVATMNSEQPSMDTSEVTSNLELITDKAKDAAQSLLKMAGSAVVKALSALKRNLTKIKDTLHDMKNGASKAATMGFGKLLRYGFGIRSMYVLFRRLRKVIIESFGELQKSGAFIQETKSNIESLKASLTTLKFQFGAAFQPIFNAIAPALQTLINYLVKVMNIISAFTAKLMGKSTYSKAVATTGAIADNVGGAAKAAKELNKQLQGFDELNNLTSNNPSGGGGGGGSAGDLSDATYVTENVDSVLGDFASELAESIKKGDWEAVGSMISEKLIGVMQSIPWNDIYAKANSFGTNLALFLKGLITPELFSELGTTIASALKTALIALKGFSDTLNEVDPETGLTGWQQFGESLSAGIKAFVDENPLQLAVDTFSSFATGILDGVLSAVKSLVDTSEGKSTMQKIAQQIADAIGSIPAKDIAFKLGQIASGLATALYQLVSNKETWTNLGKKIADGINGFFAGMNEVDANTGMTGWETLAKDISETIKGIGTAIITALKDVEWDKVGEAIKGFISGLDVGTVTILIGGFLVASGVAGKTLTMLASSAILSNIGAALAANAGTIASVALKIGAVAIAMAAAVKIGWEFGTTFGEFIATWLKNQGIISGETADGYMEIAEGMSMKEKIDDIALSVEEGTFKEAWDSMWDEWLAPVFDEGKDIGIKIKSFAFDLASDAKSFKESWEDYFGGLGEDAYDKTVEIKADVATKWNDLKSKWESLTGNFKDVTANAKMAVATEWDDVKGTWNNLTANVKDVTAKAKMEVATKWDDLKKTWETLQGKFSGVTKKAKMEIGTKWDDLKKTWETLQGKFSGVSKSATLSIGTKWKDLKTSWNNLLKKFTGKTVSIKLNLSATVESIKGWINSKVIDPLNTAIHKVALFSKVNIPPLKAMGGYADKATNVIYGEAGAEAILPLERNLGAINKIAGVMLDGMANNTKYANLAPNQVKLTDTVVAQPNYGMTNADNELLARQNALLEENNRLMQILINQPKGITQREVFNAVNVEARNYNNRTGNSPFVY